MLITVLTSIIEVREHRRELIKKKDNPEKLATLGTQNTERIQRKQKTRHYTPTNTNIRKSFK